MTHYDRVKRKRLGDILVDEDLSTGEAVIAALQEQQRTGRLLSAILIENREIGEYELARVIVEQYQAPLIDLKHYTVHKDLVALFPPLLLHQASVVPLDRFGKQLGFACQEVPSAEIAEKLKKQSPGGFYVYIASAIDIRQALHDYAPLSEDDKEVVKNAAIEAALPDPEATSSDEDSAWKDLFDSANDSILTDIGGVEEN